MQLYRGVALRLLALSFVVVQVIFRLGAFARLDRRDRAAPLIQAFLLYAGWVVTAAVRTEINAVMHAFSILQLASQGVFQYLVLN